ncbi:MAG: outer membrane protein [Alcanivorax sp.]
MQKLQQKLQKEAMTMSADQQDTLKTQGQQKMIEIQSLQRKLQKRANEAQREILEEMQPKLKTAMEAVAKREKLDVVLNAQAVMYTKPDLDITEAVGKQLNSMK